MESLLPAFVSDKPMPRSGLEGWVKSPASTASLSVMQASRILNVHADTTLRPYGLTFSRLQLLALLHLSENAVTMSRIAERLIVHPSTVTSTVERLSSAGLVAKRLNPHDGRSTLAVITEAGSDRAEAAVRELARTHFGLACYGLSQQEEIVNLLEPLRMAAQDRVLPEPVRSA